MSASPLISKKEQKELSKANALHFHKDAMSAAQQKNTPTAIATNNDKQMHISHNDQDQDHNHLPLLAVHLTTKPVHITTNKWPENKRIGKDLKQKFSRSTIHGVEIRILPESHLLKGETGLFAANAFSQFSIVGEYCGQVCKPYSHGGEYVAEMVEDSGNTTRTGNHQSMSLDAQNFGNECRAINHFENIATEANVIMQVAYVDELPRLMIVCKQDIAIGEEILLNYGKEYVESFLSGPKNPKPKAVAVVVEWEELAGGGIIGDY